MRTFEYGVKLTPDKADGGYVVTFPDWPEAITQGDTVSECLSEAIDCLDEAVASRMESSEAIPVPGRRKSKYKVSPSLQIAVKASLYIAIREEAVKNTELAKQLGVDEKVIRRLLDPRHVSKLPAMEKALRLLGRQPTLHVA